MKDECHCESSRSNPFVTGDFFTSFAMTLATGDCFAPLAVTLARRKRRRIRVPLRRCAEPVEGVARVGNGLVQDIRQTTSRRQWDRESYAALDISWVRFAERSETCRATQSM